MYLTAGYPLKYLFITTSNPTTYQLPTAQQVKSLITTTLNRAMHNFAIVVPSAAEELARYNQHVCWYNQHHFTSIMSMFLISSFESYENVI
jgi:hypothetical protein